MNNESLNTSLEKLRASLREGGNVDEETLALVQSLELDIQRLVDTKETQADPNSTVDAATALEARFEAEHPTAAGVVREIISALHKLGI